MEQIIFLWDCFSLKYIFTVCNFPLQSLLLSTIIFDGSTTLSYTSITIQSRYYVYLITVYVALPVITRHPNYNGAITVAVGSDVVLECQATGDGTLNYHWRRVSGSLPSNARRSNGGQTLTLHNIVVSENGQYYCEVDNGGERVTSSRVQVTAKSQSLYGVTV